MLAAQPCEIAPAPISRVTGEDHQPRLEGGVSACQDGQEATSGDGLDRVVDRLLGELHGLGHIDQEIGRVRFGLRSVLTRSRELTGKWTDLVQALRQAEPPDQIVGPAQRVRRAHEPASSAPNRCRTRRGSFGAHLSISRPAWLAVRAGIASGSVPVCSAIARSQRR